MADTARRAPFARWVAPAALLALVLGAKLFVAFALNGHPLLQPQGEMDSGVYLDLARRVAGGDLVAGDRVFFLSPLYVYFLAFALAVSGGSLLAVRVLQVALGTIAVALVAATARRWYGRPAAMVAGGLAALTGYFTFSETLVLQSSVDPFLTALGLWLIARAWLGGRSLDFASAGLVLGLHVLNRPNVAAWAAAAAVLTLLPYRAGGPRGAGESRTPALRSRLAWTAALAAGFALALLPVAARNYAIGGQFAPVSSHGGLNFYIGNNPEADGTYRRVPGITPSIAGQDRDMRRVAGQALGREVSDTDASAWYTRKACAWITSEPGAAIALFARKLLYVLNATDVPLNFSYAFYRDEAGAALWLFFVGPWLLLPLGLAGLWLGRPARHLVGSGLSRISSAWWRWSAVVPVYALSVAVFFVSDRYRAPLLVPLCVTAAGTLTALWRDWRAREWRGLMGGAVLVLALGAVTNLDLGLDDGLSGERTEMVLHLIDARQDVAAGVLLEKTVSGSREPAVTLFRTAAAYRGRGDLALAAPLIERAAGLDPGSVLYRRALGEVRLDLGRTALEAGDAERAVQYLAPAASADPNEPSVHEALGLALGLLGRRDEASAALERACSLAPSSASARLNLGVVYAESGRPDDARRLAQEALRLQPGYARARQFLEALPPAR